VHSFFAVPVASRGNEPTVHAGLLRAFQKNETHVRFGKTFNTHIVESDVAMPEFEK
jgi:hypothetical protein